MKSPGFNVFLLKKIYCVMLYSEEQLNHVDIVAFFFPL